ncbi:MAG: ferrous iron transport protein B, partial [Legionellales bacterium]|nr:ferrous iron transport protein B [Legionellales bacterium]
RFGSTESAFAFLVFALLYFPCMSTIAAISKEVGFKWAAVSLTWSTCLAYLVAVAIYQMTTLFAHPFSSMMWLLGSILAYYILVLGFQNYTSKIWRLSL